MSNLYEDAADALRRLRQALTKHNAWMLGCTLSLPHVAINEIEMGMPHGWVVAQGENRRMLQGIALVPMGERSPREMQLLAELDTLRRELARQRGLDKRGRDCVEAMAQIMNAVPLKDVIEAGQTVQTLTDYVVRRIET